MNISINNITSTTTTTTTTTTTDNNSNNNNSNNNNNGQYVCFVPIPAMEGDRCAFGLDTIRCRPN